MKTPKFTPITLDPRDQVQISDLILAIQKASGETQPDLTVTVLREAIAIMTGDAVEEPPKGSTIRLRDGRLATRVEEDADERWMVHECEDGCLCYEWSDWDVLAPKCAEVLFTPEEM